MSKFDNRKIKKGGGTAVIGSSGAGDTLTYNGAVANTRDAKSDLFLLGVSNFVSEGTYYESGEDRDSRYKALVHAVTAEDPQWVAEFVKYLRGTAHMRSVAVVTAAEYVKAGGPNGREVVASAALRADEPGEILAYWHSEYGRSLPAAIKRGVADAARRLYNEKSFIKYDSANKQYRFADVIQLAHVKPKDDKQSALFKLALDTRYNNVESVDPGVLPTVSAYREYNKMEKDKARKILISDPSALAASGMTWEALSSFGAMDAKAWEAIIPNMGYMALLRNLRNFDQAGVSDAVANKVIARLTDPDEVARSRQLPFRFLSAYTAAPSDRWKHPLSVALDLCLKNIPVLTGSSLILVDTSGSMGGYGLTSHSSLSPLDQAALFGAALTKSGQNVDLRIFADSVADFSFPKGQNVLKTAEGLVQASGRVGHGTAIGAALDSWNGQDRVFLITDMQTSGYVSRVSDTVPAPSSYYYYGRRSNASGGSKIPQNVPIYGFNINGYGSTVANPEKNFYEFGGLTDDTFKMVPVLEAGRQAKWPWAE